MVCGRHCLMRSTELKEAQKFYCDIKESKRKHHNSILTLTYVQKLCRYDESTKTTIVVIDFKIKEEFLPPTGKKKKMIHEDYKRLFNRIL